MSFWYVESRLLVDFDLGEGSEMLLVIALPLEVLWSLGCGASYYGVGPRSKYLHCSADWVKEIRSRKAILLLLVVYLGLGFVWLMSEESTLRLCRLFFSQIDIRRILISPLPVAMLATKQTSPPTQTEYQLVKGVAANEKQTSPQACLRVAEEYHTIKWDKTSVMHSESTQRYQQPLRNIHTHILTCIHVNSYVFLMIDVRVLTSLAAST